MPYLGSVCSKTRHAFVWGSKLEHVPCTDMLVSKYLSFSQLLVTPEGIHINLVTIVDSDIPVPSIRSSVGKVDQPAVLLSKESSALVRHVAVLHDVSITKEGQDVTHIHEPVYGLQNPALMKMKVCSCGWARSAGGMMVVVITAL